MGFNKNKPHVKIYNASIKTVLDTYPIIQFNDYEVWIQKAREAVADRPIEENLLPIWQKKNLTLENQMLIVST